MRKLGIFIIFLSPIGDKSATAGELGASFVRTETVRADGSGGRGSGICYRMKKFGDVSRILILSHAHNRKLGDPVSIFYHRSGWDNQGEVIAIDFERDVCVIAAAGWPSMKFYPIMNYTVPKGEKVRMVGFGTSRKTGNKVSIIPVDKSTTVIDNDARFEGVKYPLIRTAGDSRPGDSGGALIYEGKLAGITRLMAIGDGTNHDAGFVRAEEILAFLKEVDLQP